MKELIKEKLEDMQVEVIFQMIKDILRYLENDDSEEYEINQEIIGMQNLFRGYVVKV